MKKGYRGWIALLVVFLLLGVGLFIIGLQRRAPEPPEATAAPEPFRLQEWDGQDNTAKHTLEALHV